MHAAVPVLMADGSTHDYEVVLGIKAERVSVREAGKRRLPAFCPMRHINHDGSFCLNWEGAESLDVRDAELAERWWGVLTQFLRLQERAKRLRRWPDRREWAHGSAARHQMKARVAAAALSPRFEADLSRGRITVRRSKGNSAEGTALRLHVGDRRLLSVFEERERPATMRQACPCGVDVKPRTIRRCRDHRARFVELTRALRDQESAEAAFWASWKGERCCGTMDDCPLAMTSRGGI